MINNLKENKNIEIIKCSAKNNINVNESFIILIEKMLELGLGHQKSLEDVNGNTQNFSLNDNANKKKTSKCYGGKKWNEIKYILIKVYIIVFSFCELKIYNLKYNNFIDYILY